MSSPRLREIEERQARWKEPWQWIFRAGCFLCLFSILATGFAMKFSKPGIPMLVVLVFVAGMGLMSILSTMAFHKTMSAGYEWQHVFLEEARNGIPR